ncbi:pheromone receptor, partial [Schizophyllum fasciatum]
MLSNDPTYPLFPIVAFLAAVLALLPIPFTLQAWNTGACALAVWAAAACLLSFINSVVWAGNVVDAVPVWCDISSKLLLGASIGIPAASLCTSHRLWKVSSTQSVPETRRDFLLTIAIDLAITVGVPILVMILHSIVQDHRYTIFEDIGCHASIANTLPAYFLVLIWPLVLSLASLILAVLCLRLSYVHRLRFDDALARKGAPRTCLCLRLILLVLVVATASVVAASLRIAAVASVELDSSTTFPSSISTSTTSSSTPLPSSSPSLLPAGTYRASALASAALEAERCVPVLCALVFFVLCGLSGEASYHARVARVAGK